MFELAKASHKDLVFIFEKMIAIDQSDYAQKNELLHNYIQLLLHEGMRLQNVATAPQQNNAAERITLQFFDLLLKQFPVTSPKESVQLKIHRTTPTH